MKRKLLILFGLILLLASINLEVRYLHAVDAWLADGSTRRQKITTQVANIDGDLTWYPLYVYVDPAAQGATMTEAAADGTDIRFTQSDGTTLLDYERESWSGGNGSAVTANFWVSDAGWTINADGSTYIYIYYGSGGADGANITGVWDGNFRAVYHLIETNGATDSTSNSVDFSNGDEAGPTTVSGQIYNGQDFESGSYQSLKYAGKISNTALGTISAWINPESIAGDMSLLSYGGDATNSLRLVLSTDTYIHITTTSNDIEGDTVISTSSWQYVVLRSDGSNYFIDVDGGGDLLTANSGNDDGEWFSDLSDPASPDTSIGAWDRTYYDTFYDGIIDELRVSEVKRADAWIKFEYHNMYESDQELTWATEESSGAAYIPKVMIITGGQ